MLPRDSLSQIVSMQQLLSWEKFSRCPAPATAAEPDSCTDLVEHFIPPPL